MIDRRLIDEQNPWWTDPTWPASDIHLTEAKDAPYTWQPRPFADSELTSGALFTLRGPRRTGKTTVLKHIALTRYRGGRARRTCFLSLQPAARRQDVGAALRDVLQLFPELGDEPWLFLLDETTFVPDWARELMYLRDNVAAFRRATVILSGSSASDLGHSSSILAGRRGRTDQPLDRILLPMSFAEFVRARGRRGTPEATLELADFLDPRRQHSVREAALQGDALDRLLLEFLNSGGFPRAVTELARVGRVGVGLLEELWQTIANDVSGLGRSAPTSAKVLARVLLGLGSPMSWRSLAEELDVHKSTAEEYTRLLVDSFVIWILHQSDARRTESPSLKRDRKLYFTDPLFAHLAARVGGTVAEQPQLVENAVGGALLRHLEHDAVQRFSIHRRLFLWRSARGREIDFIARLEQPVAVEIKYARQIRPEDRLSISQAFGRGIIVTRDSLALERPVLEIPAGVFLALLSSSPSGVIA